MNKLNRTVAPVCLSFYRHGRDDWGKVSKIHKEDIWHKINEMQDGFCAYCECRLNKHHIEHFRDKSCNPRLTFDWNNLFGSCGDSSAQSNRCGHHKDNTSKVGNYNSNELIKPDEETASDYFRFLIDGTVRAIDTLDEDKLHKANETIRVFNLNGDVSLVGCRRNAINSDLDSIYELYGMLDQLDSNDWNQLLDGEIASIAGREYQTALEQAWRFCCKY